MESCPQVYSAIWDISTITAVAMVLYYQPSRIYKMERGWGRRR